MPTLKNHFDIMQGESQNQQQYSNFLRISFVLLHKLLWPIPLPSWAQFTSWTTFPTPLKKYPLRTLILLSHYCSPNSCIGLIWPAQMYLIYGWIQSTPAQLTPRATCMCCAAHSQYMETGAGGLWQINSQSGLYSQAQWVLLPSNKAEDCSLKSTCFKSTFTTHYEHPFCQMGKMVQQ